MPESLPDAYALLESSFQDVSKLPSHEPFPRESEGYRSLIPAYEPRKHDISYLDDDVVSQATSEDSTALASPGAVNRADTGLPPTPPSHSQDEQTPSTFSPPPHADGVVSSLLSRKPSSNTPVNQRSPPTPDPSPPRTTESMTVPDRPSLFAYPSSRAESFKTAREEQFSSAGGDSRTSTPLVERPSEVEEDHGLGLAFERDESDITPTARIKNPFETTRNHAENKASSYAETAKIPNREWDTNLMRNVTVRKRRNPTSPQNGPPKNPDSTLAASPATPTSPKRSNSLRQRLEASRSSPRSPTIDKFAQSIGWPGEAHSIPQVYQDVDAKRLSGSSMSSTVVEVMVIPSPPQTQRKLRHSGKNLAYRREGDAVTDHSSRTQSNRDSTNSEDTPLHRLVHKRASIQERKNRISSDSETLGTNRTASPLSVRKRAQTNATYTLAHQESVKRVLQPAAELINRSSSLSREYAPERSFHKRISSAPEPTKVVGRSREPRISPESSPPTNLEEKAVTSITAPSVERASPPTPDHQSKNVRSIPPELDETDPIQEDYKAIPNINKSLPDLPIPSSSDTAIHNNEHVQTDPKRVSGDAPRLASQMLMDAPPNAHPDVQNNLQVPIASPHESPSKPKATLDAIPTVRRGSLSMRGRSEERRRSSASQDRTSTSRDTLDLPRQSYEWYGMHSDDHRRVSFDRSTVRTEEHAMARHLYAQSTPFSQLSDTPFEVSEATAVSIYPHNNHSLLVVQQVARSSTLPIEGGHETIEEEQQFSDPPASNFTIFSPTIGGDANQDEEHQPFEQPTVTVEPSTPPMQLSLPVPGAVDSPLKNPRQAPEPPVFKVIPPTPADELDRQLVPGPPKRSDSHPQRRLSLVQRARRYSDNLISPFLARAASTRGRYASDSHVHHDKTRIPTVSDGESNLHPFWRPRGFWDGFEDSDSESDEDALPEGGDTSDLPDREPAPPARKMSVLGRRLTNGIKGSGGFLIGNSLGVERSGSNRRRHVIELPARRADRAPMILIQPPTFPIRSNSPRIEKRGSHPSMRSSGGVYERPRRDTRRTSWRKGKTIPGLGVQVQYIGLSGVKERFRERKAEKRRDEIRKSIGTRYFVDGGGPATAE